ncbi:hypothetical protein FKM82_011243 [Ascaphus truei]
MVFSLVPGINIRIWFPIIARIIFTQRQHGKHIYGKSIIFPIVLPVVEKVDKTLYSAIYNYSLLMIDISFLIRRNLCCEPFYQST